MRDSIRPTLSSEEVGLIIGALIDTNHRSIEKATESDDADLALVTLRYRKQRLDLQHRLEDLLYADERSPRVLQVPGQITVDEAIAEAEGKVKDFVEGVTSVGVPEVGPDGERRFVVEPKDLMAEGVFDEDKFRHTHDIPDDATLEVRSHPLVGHIVTVLGPNV